MRDWRTTVCGVLAAASLLGFAELGLPDPWPKLLAWLCAVALAALGYHATDCTKCPGLTARKAAGLLLVLLLVAVAGCSVARFTMRVSNPTFGSLSVSVGGGAIGKPALAAATNRVEDGEGPGAVPPATNEPPHTSEAVTNRNRP